MAGTLVLSGVLDLIVEWLQAVGIREVTGVIALAGVLLYGWRLRRVGALAGEGVRMVLVTSAAVLAMLLLGVIPDLDIGRAVALGQGAVEFIMGVLQ